MRCQNKYRLLGVCGGQAAGTLCRAYSRLYYVSGTWSYICELGTSTTYVSRSHTQPCAGCCTVTPSLTIRSDISNNRCLGSVSFALPQATQSSSCGLHRGQENLMASGSIVCRSLMWTWFFETLSVCQSHTRLHEVLVSYTVFLPPMGHFVFLIASRTICNVCLSGMCAPYATLLGLRFDFTSSSCS